MREKKDNIKNCIDNIYQQLKEKKGGRSNGAMDQLLDSMRTGEAFNKRGDRGSVIHANAVLAGEAIEMFSRVNRHKINSPMDAQPHTQPVQSINMNAVEKNRESAPVSNFITHSRKK